MIEEVEQLPFGTRFQVEQRLGAGTFGVVYRAYDQERRMRVALKSLRRVSPATIYNFKQEFRSLAGLIHPNLASLYELFSVGEHWFFTMELVEGVDFLSYVRPPVLATPEAATLDADRTIAATDQPTLPESKQRPRPSHTAPLSAVKLARATAQLAEGVYALHQAGKLHRDLKPSNVLVTPQGRVVILDFGLVTDQEAAAQREGAVVGTAAYMAPEQAAGHTLGPAADWYSVGAMLYQGATGHLPFEGGVREVMLQKQLEDPPHVLTIDPAAPLALSELSMELLAREPSLRPRGEVILQRLGVEPSQASGKSPFVGREDLLDELRSAAHEARAQGRWLRVRGASGMGKTALLRAFLDELRGAGSLVLTGRCYERESVPYKALDSIVDALYQHLLRLPLEDLAGLLPFGAPSLARLFPVLRRVPGFSAPDDGQMDPAAQRREAARCLRALLDGLAARQPLVLWIDDLQWGDLDSVPLFEELLRPPAPPLLFLASYRSELEDESELLQALARPGVLRLPKAPPLEVRPLAAHEALDLALLLLGDGDLAALARPDVIARESGGSPYLVAELVRFARRGLPRAEELTLAHALAVRIGELPEEERRLLDLAAIAGRPLPRWQLYRAARLPLEENRALSALLVKQFLSAGGIGRDDLVECYHDQVRAVAAAQLSRGQREELHAALAAALLSEGSPDPEAMVQHLQGAGQGAKAAEYAAAAAAQASQALAFERAARLYAQALTLGAEDPRRLALARAEALANAGRSREAAEVFLQEAAARPGPEALQLRERAAKELLRGGDITRGRALLAELLEGADLPMSKTATRAMLRVVWSRLQIELRGLAFKEQPASQLPAEELRKIDLCWTAAIGLGNLDTIHGADFQARGLLLALKAGEPLRAARALAAEAAFLASEGGKHRKKIAQVLEQAGALAARVQDPYTSAFLTLVRGEVAFLLGEMKEAKGYLLDAEAQFLSRCQGPSWELATARFYLLFALYYLGELRSLGGLQADLSRDAERRGDLYSATMLCSGHAATGLLAADDPASARQLIQNSAAAWTPEGFHVPHYSALLMNAELDLYEGEPARAVARVEDAWPRMEASLLLKVQVIRLEVLLLKARCGLALYTKTQDPRRLDQVERDLRAVTREKMPWSDAHAALVEAGMHHARGDAVSTQVALERAERGLSALGVTLYAAAARIYRGAVERDTAALIAAEETLRTELVAPEKFLRVLAPGFHSSPS